MRKLQTKRNGLRRKSHIGVGEQQPLSAGRLTHLLATPLLSIPTRFHWRSGNASTTRVARGHGGDDRGSFILALVVVHQHFNGDMFACKNALHARLNVGGLVARWNAHGHLRAVVWHVLYRVVFRIIYFFVR